MSTRFQNRPLDSLRPVKFTRFYTRYAEGSVLAEFGNTKVLCNASIVPGVPKFLKGSGTGWVTAEYGMLPRATHLRVDREAVRGKQSGRTQEIQRLIGRSMRSIVNLKELGENTIMLDCDVIQADGGTRVASISGSCIALVDAISYLAKTVSFTTKPISQLVAAVSVGMVRGQPYLDLDYGEDSSAQVDFNVVMLEDGSLVEVQGTAEHGTYTQEQLNELITLARGGLQQIIALQREVLELDL